MYTAFLALPPLNPQTGKTEPATTFIPETNLTAPPEFFELSSTASHTVNGATHKLNSTLSNNVTVRYVVVPAMFGGLGSVALRLIQEGGSFMATANAQAIDTQDGEEISAQAATVDKEQGSEENLGQIESSLDVEDNSVSNTQGQQTATEESVVHDFVPSIQLGAGLEFLILVTSSILLGAVVGFIGTILSLDGPPEKANNKSKLAATSLMFALFFPSVITVFQENAMSQAKLIRADEEKTVLEEKVRETTQQAENLEEVAHDRIINDIETLDIAPETIEPSLPNDLAPLSRIQATSPTNSQISLIDSTKALVLNATSDEKAQEFIDSIFKIGNVDDGAVRDHAVRALGEINENPALSEAVQQAAEEKAEELQNMVADDLQESP